MKIRIEFPPGTKIEVFQPEDGDIFAIEVEPFFATTRGTATWGFATITSGLGKITDQVMLAASGIAGKLLKRERNESAKPLIDMTPEELAARKPFKDKK